VHAETLTVNMLLLSVLDCTSAAKSDFSVIADIYKVLILVIIFGEKLRDRGTISVILQTPYCPVLYV